MPYEFENTTPVNEQAEGEEGQPYPNVYDRAYETVRPTCHYDLKKIDFFSQGKIAPRDDETIESTFKRVGVTYDYFEDYEKWAHVEANPPYPLEIGPGNAVPAPSPFTDRFQTYGFNYSSKMGIGNRKYNWYSHTDLDIELFKIIRDDIRKPILIAVKDAKQRQDILGACNIQKSFKKREDDTGEPSPNFPEIIYYRTIPEDECNQAECPDEKIIVDCFAEPPEEGYPEDCPPNECPDWSCKKLQEVINNIPLECTLIEEYLGSEYKGTNFDRYWWEGWEVSEGGVSATKQMLDSVYQESSSLSIPEGFNGTTFSIPTPKSTNAEAPYQNIIGAFKCSGTGTDEEILLDPLGDYPELDGVIKRPTPQPPFYGAFGGFTADACGCLEVSESTISESLPDYIEKCQYPTTGEKFPEYLQYIASEDVRYWNTPNETPLYRKAQMQLLMSNEIAITVPGDFNVKVGSIIKTVFPVALNSENPEGDSGTENQMNGKWLVVKIKHIFQAPALHKMKLTCIRDSKYIE